MTEGLLWFDRAFPTGLPAALLPSILERLGGTSARLEEKLRLLSPEALRNREGSRWSIQENLGHLLDLEEIHAGRLEDFAAGAEVLRPADPENRKTQQARHNETPTLLLLHAFREARRHVTERLAYWDASRPSRTALHPRLRLPMTVVDLAFFVAEHDDHHLARMTELARRTST